MTPRYRSEPARAGIRRARKPMEHPLLAGVVLVVAGGRRSTARIRFAEDMVDIVGTALPYGVSIEKPAFLKLLYYATRKVWRLYAFYIDRSKGALLWEYMVVPKWVTLSEVTGNEIKGT